MAKKMSVARPSSARYPCPSSARRTSSGASGGVKGVLTVPGMPSHLRLRRGMALSCPGPRHRRRLGLSKIDALGAAFELFARGIFPGEGRHFGRRLPPWIGQRTGACIANGPPDALGGAGHVDVSDAEVTDRVDHCILHGGGGPHGGRLADPLGPELVRRRRRLGVGGGERR